MLSDIVKFKLHIQKSLEDYETFVIEEAEQEISAADELDNTQKVEE